MHGLSGLSRLDEFVSRSISAENRAGARGGGAQAVPVPGSPARELGQGWKASPRVDIAPHATFEMARITGPGLIKHVWITGKRISRNLILRGYWDDQAQPSIECPRGDFFTVGWGPFAHVSSVPVAVNPNYGLKRLLGNGLSNAQFRRTNPLPYRTEYALVEIKGDGQYVGTCLAVGVTNSGWWG